MSTVWNHPMCSGCWADHYPERTPVRIVRDHRTGERCAWCGAHTHSGIYVRHNPEPLPYAVLDDAEPWPDDATTLAQLLAIIRGDGKVTDADRYTGLRLAIIGVRPCQACPPPEPRAVYQGETNDAAD